jgi:ATP-dependent protease ClpP protease subunit
MRLYRTHFASFMACALAAAAVVAGPEDHERTGRKWFSIVNAGNGVGEISIFDFVDRYGANAKDFQKELKGLGAVSTLNIHINSPGGDVFEGQAIYNLIRAHKAATKTVYIDGLAASIASVIAMAGDKVVMPANTMMMIHDPSLVAWGTAEDLRKNASVLDKVKSTLVAAYQAKTGLEPAEIEQLMAEETWFTAAEAVEKRFADQSVDAVDIAASFDLSKFKNPPRDFLAAMAGAGTAATPPGTRRPSAGEQDEDPDMLITRATILALANTIGLAQSMEVSNRADELVAEKADLDKVIAELTKLKPAASALPTQEQLNTAIQGALTAERTRVTEIRAVAKQLKIDGVAELTPKVDEIVAAGTSVNDARIKLIDLRAQHEESVGPIISFSGNTQTFDNPEFRRDALATAFAHRAKPEFVKMTDQAKPFAMFSILEIAAECVRANTGKRIAIGDRDTLVAQAMLSTSDFPYILGNVVNKILLPAYQAATPSYRQIAAQKNFNDFRAHNFLRLGDFPDLLKVDESGEVKFGAISESKESVTMYAYGRILPVTRQMLINDDLSAFTDMAALAGIRVANFENAACYTVLTSNSNLGPTMTDGNKLFDSTNHGNYTSSGTAVNIVAELGKSRAKMRKQTGLDGVKLNLVPRILLVGPDNETAAEQVTTQITPALLTSVNRIGPSLQPVSDANISGNGWYMFADPAMAPCLIYGSLAGQAGPRVMTQQGWTIEGVEIKVMRDFGTGAIDYRPATFNAGAAPS